MQVPWDFFSTDSSDSPSDSQGTVLPRGLQNSSAARESHLLHLSEKGFITKIYFSCYLCEERGRGERRERERERECVCVCVCVCEGEGEESERGCVGEIILPCF